MEMLNNYVTNKQKETSAIINMRDAVARLAKVENISYDEAMLRFSSSNVYNALFDYDTGIWKESPVYLVALYERYGKSK